jgi:hypothetical protein
MKPAPDSTSNRPAGEPRPRAERERSATPLRIEGRLDGPSFDLLNSLLPEWPAQACSWA